ncbi:MAG: type 1 glutamine amidotransferase [Acidobacteria bacterium]|nr:type 1 glutamine amidotransferase [Acidobacteriota bacterium]
MKKNNRLLTLITGDASPYCQKKYGDYGDLFESLLMRTGETWLKRDVVRDGVSDLPDVDGVIVTGSAATAHDRLDWMLALEAQLRTYIGQEVPVVGVCFGHQALAWALGGETSRNSDWEVGTKPLTGHMALMGVNEWPRLLQIHRDHVTRLPKDCVIHASSQQTPIQVFSYRGLALGIQGHPEFWGDIVSDLVEARVARGLMTQAHLAQAQKESPSKNDRFNYRQLIRRFLEN